VMAPWAALLQNAPSRGLAFRSVPLRDTFPGERAVLRRHSVPGEDRYGDSPGCRSGADGCATEHRGETSAYRKGLSQASAHLQKGTRGCVAPNLAMATACRASPTPESQSVRPVRANGSGLQLRRGR